MAHWPGGVLAWCWRWPERITQVIFGILRTPIHIDRRVLQGCREWAAYCEQAQGKEMAEEPEIAWR